MQGRVKLVNAQVKPVADKMTFLKDGNDVVTGITAIAAFGHTPGHMAYMIESGGTLTATFVLSKKLRAPHVDKTESVQWSDYE